MPTYSGSIAGGMPNDPNQNIGSGSAIPGNTIGTDVSDQSPGLIQEDITINTQPTGDITFTIDPAGYVPPADLPPASHAPHPEILAKLDELNQKVDHILEHLHQPLTGTVHLECPPKVPSGQT
tara:strand:- start:4524 stop:4892 length:369 start_codon:yes stop_codon:yes gene_type:complete